MIVINNYDLVMLVILLMYIFVETHIKLLTCLKKTISIFTY